MAEIYWATLNPVITEEAGTRGGTHMGVDLKANRGDPVIAPFDGEVIYAGGDGASGRLPGTDIWANGEALVVRIRRADGFIAHVAHMDTLDVRVGQQVVGGQRVGGAGDTGWSTGVHVHQELRWDLSWNGGNWVNPRTLNMAAFQATQSKPSTTSKKRRKTKMDYASVCYLMPNKNYLVKVFCLGNGEEHHYEVNNLEYINNIAKTYQCGPNSIITKSHYDAISKATAATRKRLDAR